jgi:two-component system chemotaxis response regulator CheY
MARLLVVDDDEADRVVLRTILERAQHEVWVAKDGAEALTHFQRNPIDVVITDLQMDNVHGLELITILRELSPRPGIIAISATGEAQLDMARLMGASHTLQKPIRPDLLLNAIADLSRGATSA